jgi:hypothetical protein
MVPQLVELTSLGSGTGPQTPTPHGAASCGHYALASHQGQLLLRATVSPALAA